MGLLQNLNERFLSRKYGDVEVKVDDSLPESVMDANYQELTDFLSKIRKASKARKEVYNEIDQMAFDSLVGSGMSLVADDATQIDPIREKSVWITSDDAEIQKYCNDFLEDIGMEDNIWTYAYQVIRYGSMFLKTYHSEFESGKAPEEIKNLKGYMFEREDDPSRISDLQKYGFTVGYAETKVDNKNRETHILHPVDDYIHFINDRMGRREKVNLTYTDGNEQKSDEFKIRYGVSLFDDARQAWAMLDLIEMLLIYLRFGRSAFYRMFKVEVGGASRTEVIRILREVKAAFNVQDNLDLKNNTYTGVKKPLPHGENVYLPVKQGKGDVNVEEVGGNVDIKEIADLEYWRNKLFAAMRMPKAYLGFEETQPGGLGNVSLTRQDIRYARSVKVVKRVLVNGITDMMDFHMRETGHEDWVGRYEVFMAKVMSAEVSDIEDETLSNIQLAEALKALLSDVESIDQENLIKVIIDDILDLADKFPELVKGGDKGGRNKE